MSKIVETICGTRTPCWSTRVLRTTPVVGVTGGTSTPIEDLRDVTQRIIELAGTPDAQARARELADAALAAAATPAGRTTSLPDLTARSTVGAA